MSEFPHLILARKAFFSSGIHYSRSEWSEEKNQAIYGSHSRPQGHGYNFVLEVRVQGRRDPVTGLVVNLSDVEKDLQAVVKTLDHRHLAFDMEAFKDKAPTLENVAQHCFAELKKGLGSQLAGIRLRQGEDDWLDINRD